MATTATAAANKVASNMKANWRLTVLYQHIKYTKKLEMSCMQSYFQFS